MAKTLLRITAALVFASLVLIACSRADASTVRVLLDESLTSGGGSLATTHILRSCRVAREQKAKFLIIEIDSWGNNIDLVDVAADEIVSLNSSGITTIAFIRGKCWGAAFYLALHCSKIYGSNMASISPFPGDSNRKIVPLESSEKRAVLEKALFDAAERGGHNPVILNAFFGTDKSFVVNLSEEPKLGDINLKPYRIPGRNGIFYVVDEPTYERIRNGFGGLVTGVFEYPEGGTKDEINGSNLIFCGLLEDIVGDSDNLRASLGVQTPVPPLEIRWYEKLAVFLYIPVILIILLTFGFLALFIELHAPGTFIGAGIALLFFGLYFWATMYVGTADVIELGIFLIAILFIAIEVIAIPGFGIVGLLGILLLMYSLFATFIPGLLPIGAGSPYDSHIFGLGRMGNAVLILTSSFILVFTGALFLARFIPTMPLLERLVHKTLVPESQFVSLQTKSSNLIGRLGVTLTELRPAGKVDIDGSAVDAQSQGEFIEKGRKVRVIKAGFGVIVEEV